MFYKNKNYVQVYLDNGTYKVSDKQMILQYLKYLNITIIELMSLNIIVRNVQSVTIGIFSMGLNFKSKS